MIKLCKGLIFFLIIGCSSCQGMQQSNQTYAVYVGTNPLGFAEDSSASASGEKINGGVFLYINENPIAFYGGGGKVIQINQWIKKDKNSFSFKGFSSKALYVKVAKYDFQGNFEILAKTRIESGNVESIDHFSSDIDYSLPFFSCAISDKDNLMMKKEIQHEIDGLIHKIKNDKPTQIYDQLLLAPSLWQPMAYKVNWMDIEPRIKNRIKNQYIEAESDDILYNNEKLRFVFGKNLVYVYSGIDREDAIPTTYLFKIANGDQEKKIPAAKFVKYKNEWVLWH